MNAAPAAGLPGTQITLFDYALRLHRETPDSPFPLGGEPFPDEELHPRWRTPSVGRHFQHGEAARILEAYFGGGRSLFARSRSLFPEPYGLAFAFHDIHASVVGDSNVAAGALEEDEAWVRQVGRWLVRRATDRCAVLVGLRLLETTARVEDIPLLQTIGLLHRWFGSEVVDALKRLPDCVEPLLWFADHVTGWARLHLVDELCRRVDEHPAIRPWLLHKAADDGDFANGYFAGKVAVVAELHTTVTEFGGDSDLVDHTGRLLAAMKSSEGMGISLRHYAHTGSVLVAYVHHVGLLAPTAERYLTIALLAHWLSTEPPGEPVGLEAPQQQALRAECLALLGREDWCETARKGLDAGDDKMVWLATWLAPKFPVPAFAEERAGATE